MSTHYKQYLLAIAVILSITGCTSPSRENPVVAEGVLLSVEYRLEDARTGGFTRLNISTAVPGRNGSWNVDAYGRLTRDFLIITRPQRPDLGSRVIPAHRIVDIQFGDGGIKTVNENQPAPAK